ncbi:hypothetical protein OG713_42385 [Streptomyces sp. NBC_00723]|uniref:hypothetical protein n=1 Tax=Streptomyces sp. NBC_00723 TaxID=2903673 RepID=UPI00386DCC3E
MTPDGPRAQQQGDRCGDGVDALLAAAHDQLGIAVTDRVNARGGPPELRTPDLALDRLLAASHRSLGHGVSRRLSREASAALAQRHSAHRARMGAKGSLSRRPAAVRVKYREDALRMAHLYWPFDLAEAMHEAIRMVQDLCDLLGDAAQPLGDALVMVTRLRGHLERVSQLPEPHRPPMSLTGLDYLDAVESVLADPAERLAGGLHAIRELLDEELAPTVAVLDPGGRPYLFGVDAVAQDLIDDLAVACEEADVLARAVAEVERASNDFVGADLSGAKLDGVLLEGILWDATTLWPAQWETRVRHASLPCGEEEGILIVAAEGSDSVVPAEA